MLGEIVAAVKKKRELAALDDAFVLEKIERVLKENKKIRTKIEKSKSFKEFSRGSDFKELKRIVREELRKVYGVFDKDEKNSRKGLLQQLAKESTNEEIITKILEMHQSSVERIHEYKIVYRKIKEFIGEPRSVLDLGCGSNPYSYLLFSKNADYLAVDLPSDDLKDIKKFFSIVGLEGRTLGLDLAKGYEKLRKEKVDVALLFKVLDSLEEVKRHISHKVLDAIDATWVVVSFPTMSLGGKKHIKKERRAWFEKLLLHKGWYYETFSISNEIFYVILKKPNRLAEIRYGRRKGEDKASYEQYSFEEVGDKLKEYIRSGKVLDHGCGIGRDVEMLTKKGFDVTGIDRAEKLLEIAREKSPSAHIIKGDILTLPFKDKEFDAVWSMASLVHLYNQELEKALSEIHRVLKEKGTLFVSVKEGEPRLDERQGVKLYFMQFSEEEIRNFIEKAGFEILSLEKKVRKKNKEGIDGNFFNIWARKR